MKHVDARCFLQKTYYISVCTCTFGGISGSNQSKGNIHRNEGIICLCCMKAIIKDDQKLSVNCITSALGCDWSTGKSFQVVFIRKIIVLVNTPKDKPVEILLHNYIIIVFTFMLDAVSWLVTGKKYNKQIENTKISECCRWEFFSFQMHPCVVYVILL